MTTRNPQILTLFKGAEVRLDWHQTQWLDPTGRLVLGGRAGPSSRLTNLCHEMAHLVEIDDERCGMLGYGLQVRRIEVLGQSCVEPLTLQCTERECRVTAYQANLLRWARAEKTISHLVQAFRFLPDFHHVPGATDKQRLQWCEVRVRELSRRPEFSVRAFLAEWWRKNWLLQERRLSQGA